MQARAAKPRGLFIFVGWNIIFVFETKPLNPLRGADKGAAFWFA
ncbi:MAG TPA: hypothetical protein VGC26_05075 [Afipia sp.]